ncbi:MAG: hypothetical protein AAB536_01580 [Patescibacteria group bacterium]
MVSPACPEQVEWVEPSAARNSLINMASKGFGDFVKAVVDVNQEIMAVGGEFYGSSLQNLIGYFDEFAFATPIFPNFV